MSVLNIFGSQTVARAQTIVVIVVLGILTVFAVSTLANIDADLLASSPATPFGDVPPSRADVLRLPRLRRHHLHGEGPRRPVAPAPAPYPRSIATVIYVAVALGVFGTLTVDEVISSGGTDWRSPPSRRSAGPATGS